MRVLESIRVSIWVLAATIAFFGGVLNADAVTAIYTTGNPLVQYHNVPTCVTGNWKITTRSGSASQEASLELQQIKGNLSGKFQGTHKAFPIVSTVQDNHVFFEMKSLLGQITFTGTVEGNTMSGSMEPRNYLDNIPALGLFGYRSRTEAAPTSCETQYWVPNRGERWDQNDYRLCIGCLPVRVFSYLEQLVFSVYSESKEYRQ
jgi:hypothetical protein